jgi:glycosyltransferase involved in cell wall biosynthesis
VVITGFLSDVRGPLAACDTVALVSKTEAFSIAALEAMAMGKPMIMSDVGGAREQVVHKDSGFLFPSGDVHALAECLRECSDSRLTRAMGIKARRRVETEFSQQTMAARYVELLASALEL